RLSHHQRPGSHLDLPPFPTRRSSDLSPGGLEPLPFPSPVQGGNRPDTQGLRECPPCAPPARRTFWRVHCDPGDLRCRLQFEQSLDRKSTRLNSSHVKISYAVFCLKKK